MNSASFFDDIDQETYERVKDLHVGIIPDVIKNELAVLLNPTSKLGKDWRDLAGVLGFHNDKIRYIQSLKVNCDFLEMIKMYEKVPGNSVGKIMEGLFRLGRKDALKTFNRFYKTMPSVFVTYDYRPNHMKHILQLLDNMKNNGIVTKADEKSDGVDVPEKTMKRFHEAEFVVVCISDSYSKTISTAKWGRDVNTATIYRAMRDEYRHLNENRRFIPLLLPGANKYDAPDWLCNICPNEIFYNWPKQYKDIIRHIKYPYKVEDKIRTMRNQDAHCPREIPTDDAQFKSRNVTDRRSNSLLNDKDKIMKNGNNHTFTDEIGMETHVKTTMDSDTNENINQTGEDTIFKTPIFNKNMEETLIEDGNTQIKTQFQNCTEVAKDEKCGDIHTEIVELKQMVARGFAISEQRDHVLSEQMYMQDKALSRQIEFQGNMENFEAKYKTSLLEENKRDLHEHMKPSLDLLNSLFRSGIINVDQMSIVNSKITNEGKIKHLLYEIDAYMVDNHLELDVIKQFITILKSSNDSANVCLATKLAESRC